MMKKILLVGVAGLGMAGCRDAAPGASVSPTAPAPTSTADSTGASPGVTVNRQSDLSQITK